MTEKKKKRGRPKGSGKKKKNGRPLKLTQKMQDEICEILSEGNYIETAAGIVGVNKTTIYDWLRRGAREQQRRDEGKEVNNKEELFVKFSNAVKKAEAGAERSGLDIINRAAQDGNWQAIAWRMERKNYKRWGRKQAVEVTGENGGPVQVKQTITIGGKVYEF